MTTKADELAKGVAHVFGGKKLKREENSDYKWYKDAVVSIINDMAENLPPMRMLKGMVEGSAEEFFVKGIPPVQAARGIAKKAKAFATGEGHNEAHEDILSGLAGSASFLGTGPNAVLPSLAGKVRGVARTAIDAEKKLTKKLVDKIPALGKKIEVDMSTANSNLPKMKLLTEDAGNARKFAKARKLIEESGGKNLKIDDKTGQATWTKGGKKQTADLTQRFGPRNLKMDDRSRGMNPRAEDADDIAVGDRSNLQTLKADKDDIVSRVSEKSGVSRQKMRELHETGEGAFAKEKLYDELDDELDEWDDSTPTRTMRAPKAKMSSRNIDDDLPALTGRHAADAGGTSTEEIARQGSFYKIGKNGEPTYLSKAVDAGNLGPDDAIIHVVPGREPVIYQGSGPKIALNRFKKSRTGSEFYKHELHAGGKPKAGKKRQTLTATQIPTIDASRYGNHVTDRVRGRKVNFASDFDKVAYALANSKVPNRKILNHVMGLTKFDEDTILQHGFRIKNSVEKHLSSTPGKKAVTLHPRSIQVIGTPADVSMRRQLWGLPSEYKFAGDLPALRQSFRPVVTHPFKTGLPAFKRALKSMTERGYREQIEKFPDELAVYDVLDTAKAIGPTKARKLYPHIKDIEKLGGTKHDVYDYFSSGTLGEQLPIAGNLPKVSKRMFDVFQRSVRGTEVQRGADLLGKSVEQLAKEGDTELPSMLRSVNERSGFGPLGKLEAAGEEMAYWFNAPRNTMAKAQFYNPLNYVPESVLPKFIVDKGLGGRYGTTMKSPILHDIWKDTAKLGAGYGALKLASDATGIGEVNLDPRSSVMGADFDNWRPDIFGGEKGIPQTMGKMIDPQGGINAKGDEYDVDPSKEFLKFMRYRLKPGIPSMLGDLLLGYNRDTQTRENAIGEDISLPFDEESPVHDVLPSAITEAPYSRWIANQFTTSWPEDVYDAATGAGPVQGVLAGILGGAGMGSSTFDPYNPYQPYRAENKFIRIPKREKKNKEAMPGGIR